MALVVDGSTNPFGKIGQVVGNNLGVNAVSASNLLDDYEEGTWTPSWSAGGGS